MTESKRGGIRRRITGAAAVAVAAGLTLSGCLFEPLVPPTPTGSADPTDGTGPSETFGPDSVLLEHQIDPTEGVDAALQEFYGQDVAWEVCGENLCADIKAPMDWFNPDPAKSITLALVIAPAAGQAESYMLFNPGGPGASGFDYVDQYAQYLVSPRVAEKYHMVGFDPRGVGRSTAISCYDDPQELYEYIFEMDGDPSYSDPLSDEAFDATEEAAKEFGESCKEHTGEPLQYFGTPQAASDMDLIRGILGREKLDYYGVSYGTVLGATYADLFPERVGRMVLDAVSAPDASPHEGNVFQAKGFELALGNFLEACIQDKQCPIDAKDRKDALKKMSELFDELDKKPLKGSNNRVLSGGGFFMSLAANLYADFQWPAATEIIADVKAGDPESAFTAIEEYYGVNPDGTFADNSYEALVAVNCLDGRADTDRKRIRDQAKEVKEAAPTVGRYFVGMSSCVGWPYQAKEDPKPVEAKGADPIILIGGRNDPATAYDEAVRLHDQLDSSVLISVEAEGHGQYNQGNMCVDDPVDEFWLTGTVPPGDIDDC